MPLYKSLIFVLVKFVSRLLISPFKSWCFTFLNVHTLHCLYHLQYSNLNFVTAVIQPAMFDLYILNILNQRTVDIAFVYKDLNFFRWNFNFYFPQALLVFLPLPKLFKPTNLSEVLTWYSSITFKSFGFLNSNVSISKFGVFHLLTNSLSLTFWITILWSAWQTVPLKAFLSSMIQCRVQSVMMWSLWLWIFSSDFRLYLQMFQCGNTVLWAIRFLCVTRFTTPTPW